MEITLAVIRIRPWRPAEPARQLLDSYIARSSKTLPASFEEFRTEAALWASVEKRRSRSAPFLILTHSTGHQLDSEGFARELAQVRDRGVQQVVIAIGPADGWSAESLRRADLLLSFGRMTLPHELAAIVAAEQIYRATTIWSGHPYHGGH
jgi:23S rRNA (pseudouridine1915-N3)-methyltransferase